MNVSFFSRKQLGRDTDEVKGEFLSGEGGRFERYPAWFDIN
jgi:hypothetical protein